MMWEDASMTIRTVLTWALLICSIIPLAIWRGFVLTKLWLYFAVPLGADVISIAHAIGLSFLVVFATNTIITKTIKDNREPMEKMVEYLLIWAFWPGSAWAVCAIIHSFM